MVISVPYNRRQIANILNVRGQPLISPTTRLPLATRVTESYIRRRLYHTEDKAAERQFDMIRAANRDIRQRSLDIAQHLGVRSLAIDGKSLSWTRQTIHVMRGRFLDLARDLLRDTLSVSGEAYLYGYYGRGWVLDMSTKRDIRLNLPLPDRARITKAILQPRLSEAFTPDFTTLDQYSSEYVQAYTDVLDDVTRKMRGQFSIAQSAGETPLGALQRLSDRLGTSGDGSKGAAGMLGTLTRSTVQSSATQGSAAVYDANDDILVGVMFLSSQDSRVCPTCNALDGSRWVLGDPDLRYPVSDTHVNCRCSLVGITASEAEIDSDDPPDMSWAEWLKDRNIQFLADEFEGTAMDTEQV